MQHENFRTLDVELSEYKSYNICYRVTMTSKLSHHALCIDVVYLKRKIVKTYSKQRAEIRSCIIGKYSCALLSHKGSFPGFVSNIKRI